jgi:hypothetical protein
MKDDELRAKLEPLTFAAINASNLNVKTTYAFTLEASSRNTTKADGNMVEYAADQAKAEVLRIAELVFGKDVSSLGCITG